MIVEGFFLQVSGLKAIGNIKDSANQTKLSAEFDVCKMTKINTSTLHQYAKIMIETFTDLHCLKSNAEPK